MEAGFFTLRHDTQLSDSLSMARAGPLPLGEGGATDASLARRMRVREARAR